HLLEGEATGEIIRSDYAWDDYGNQVLTVLHGAWSPSDPHYLDDEQVTESEFIIDVDSWRLRLPKRVVRGGLDLSGPSPAVIALEESCFVYDASPDCDTVTLTEGLRTATRSWHHNPITAVDEMETIEQVSYTPRGLPEVITDALLYETHHTYDTDFGLFLESETLDPTGLQLITRQVVDPRHGGVTSMTTPDGATTLIAFDGLGRQVAVARPGDTLSSPTSARSYSDGAPFSYWVDVAKDGTADGLISTTAFDARGNAICRTQEGEAGLEVVAHQEFSAAGRAVIKHHPYPAAPHAGLPRTAAGCLPVSIRRLGSAVVRVDGDERWRFDSAGRNILTIHPGGTRVETTHRPLETTVLDEEDTRAGSPHENTPKVLATDGLGRTIRVDETHIFDDSDPGTHSFEYAYTALGDLMTVTDSMANVVFDATYDSRRRRVQSVDADRGSVQSSYDARGALIQQVDARGEIVDYTWDAAGRVLSVAASDGVVSYEYDAHPDPSQTAPCHSTGRLARVTDLAGNTSYCYDDRGRQTDVHREFVGLPTPFETSFEFDALDRPTAVVHADGVELEYAYDDAGRLDEITASSLGHGVTIVRDVIYEPFGAPATISLGNGATIERTYDSRLRPLTLSARSPAGVVQDLTLELDGVGNVTSVVDGLGVRSASYTYDDLYRLTEATGLRYGGETATYRYDRLGNMTEKRFSDSASGLDVGVLRYDDPLRVHAVTDAGGETFTYDAAGNLASDAQYRYGWTPFSMLGSVEDALSGVAVVEYTYDHRQRRAVARQLASGDEIYFLNDVGAEYRVEGASTGLHKHITVAGIPVGRIEDTFDATTVDDRLTFIAVDHLSSPMIVLDTAGAVVERWDSHPYGEENRLGLDDAGLGADYRAPADTSSAITRRFQGREIDRTTGAYDFGARVYRADLGRFMSPDSVVPGVFSSQAWNRYAFVRNNPLRFVDPTGHQDVDSTQSITGNEESPLSLQVTNFKLKNDQTGISGQWTGGLEVGADGVQGVDGEFVWAMEASADRPYSLDSIGGDNFRAQIKKYGQTAQLDMRLSSDTQAWAVEVGMGTIGEGMQGGVLGRAATLGATGRGWSPVGVGSIRGRPSTLGLGGWSAVVHAVVHLENQLLVRPLLESHRSAYVAAHPDAPPPEVPGNIVWSGVRAMIQDDFFGIGCLTGGDCSGMIPGPRPTGSRTWGPLGNSSF
ncbi:MAG: RHS repeat-associated core domain-containing protein, partial [Myxococcota bacterium]